MSAELDNVLAASMRGMLAPGKRLAYVLAGSATITVRSVSTGTRFTYKIKKADGPKPLWYVGLLSGPDNESGYQYLGIVVPRGDQYVAGVTTFFDFRRTSKSCAGVDAPSVRTISWLTTHMESPQAEVRHEGRCGRCGRTLTVPESIESGLGPTCAGR